MLVYISGPVIDTTDYAERFTMVKKRLEQQGHKIIDMAPVSSVLPKLPYMAYMDVSMALLRYADAIYMMDGWQESRLARMEHDIAVAEGKHIIGHT